MDNAKSDMDWKGGEMTEDMRERKQQQRIYAAIVDSLIEQNSPDTVSGMKIMDAITPYLALSSAGTSGTPDTIIQGDMFWDADDPEMAQDSPEEILRDDYRPKKIAEFQQATRHSNFFGFYTIREDAPTDDVEDFHFFATKEEAEIALRGDSLSGKGEQ